MKNIVLAAETALDIPGVLGFAVFHSRTGETVFQLGMDAPLTEQDSDTYGSAYRFQDRPRKRHETTEPRPSLTPDVEDILITGDECHYVLRPLSSLADGPTDAPGLPTDLLVILKVEREAGCLGFARLKLKELDRQLSLSSEEHEQLRRVVA